jgi:hypothetical protein
MPIGRSSKIWNLTQRASLLFRNLVGDLTAYVIRVRRRRRCRDRDGVDAYASGINVSNDCIE